MTENEKNVRIFDPEGIKPEDYKSTYSELQAVGEFKDLTGVELMIVWWYSNPTSPLIEIKDTDKRLKQAIEKLYPKDEIPEKYHKVTKSSLSQRIKIAIERMKVIKPIERMTAHDMVETIFKDFKAIINTPVEKFKKSDDTTDYTGYINVRKSILNQLEDIVKMREMGFGVSDGVRVKERTGQQNIERRLKKKKEK